MAKILVLANYLGCTKHQLYKALTLGRLLFKTIKVNYE